MIVDLPPDAVDFARAWAAMKAALPDAPQVRITLRRKTGQVLCQVGKVQRTGTTEAEAVAAVAKALR